MKTRKITGPFTVTVDAHEGKLIVRAYELFGQAVARGDMGPAIALVLLSLETGKQQTELMTVMGIAMSMYYNNLPLVEDWEDPYSEWPED